MGLALARDRVRAVLVRRGNVVWAAEAAMEADRPVEATIASLVAEAPVPPFSRPTLSAAVGPHASQVKLVAGLPEVQDLATLAAIVRESAGSFFLKDGVPLITTGVRAEGVGAAWAAAIDQPSVDAIRTVCRARRWRPGPIAPTAVVLPLALADESFTWTDGGVALDVTRSDLALASVRRRSGGAAEAVGAGPQAVPALASLGDGAARYADAYGATALRSDEPLALHPEVGGLRPFARPGLVLLVAVLSLALSPLAAMWARKRAEARIAAVRSEQWQAMVAGLTQLDQITRTIDEVSRFTASRSNVTVLLGDLARALPDGSVLLSFEMDGQTGKASFLALEASATLRVVRGLPQVASADLVGPVSRITMAGRELERVAIQFRLSDRMPPRDAGDAR